MSILIKWRGFFFLIYYILKVPIDNRCRVSLLLVKSENSHWFLWLIESNLVAHKTSYLDLTSTDCYFLWISYKPAWSKTRFFLNLSHIGFIYNLSSLQECPKRDQKIQDYYVFNNSTIETLSSYREWIIRAFIYLLLFVLYI